MNNTFWLIVVCGALGSPVVWALLYILLCDRVNGKRVFWITFTIFLALALFFFIGICDAEGWDGIGWLLVGSVSVFGYNLLALVGLLLFRRFSKPLSEESASD